MRQETIEKAQYFPWLIADAGTLFSAEPGEDASYNEMLFSDATDSYNVDVSKIAKVEFTTSN